MDEQPNSGPEPVPPIPPAGTPPPSSTPPPATPGPEVPPPPQPDASGTAYSQGVPPPMPGEPGSLPSKDERLWAVLIHLSPIIGALSYTLGIPGGNLLLPLILWLIRREGAPFVEDQGKEVINFQITMTIAGAVLLAIVCIGWVLLPVLGIYALVLGIVGAVKANDGTVFRYPLTLRLVT